MTDTPLLAPVKKLCPSCDSEWPEAQEGPLCPKCGARLIELRESTDELIGKVIHDRFEIRARLGQGGMGTVYRAWQRSVRREVAIKLIDRAQSGDVMAARRFLREARLASQLSHPNTVSILDFGQTDEGRLFIVMELVRGLTLGDVVARDGALSVSRAAAIAVQLCDALEAAHRLQIVHRDLKPSNIVILDDPPGRDLLKLLDFGLAKSLAADESESTGLGMVLGTPWYMAPEVARGEKPTPSSDLYALGVILGEITSGERLWDVENTDRLMIHKLAGAEITARVPAALLPLVQRVISPVPAARPESAAELRALLLPLAEGRHDAGARPPPSSAPRVADADAATVERMATPARAHQVTEPATVARPARPFVAIAAVSVLAIALFLGRTPDEKPLVAPPVRAVPPASLPASVPTPPEPSETAPPDTPDLVTVRVSSTPEGATLSIFGAAAGTTPVDVRLKRGVRVTLELSHDGQTIARSIVPESDRSLLIVLPAKAKTGGDALPF
jgi:serine/threonine-protein kinase